LTALRGGHDSIRNRINRHSPIRGFSNISHIAGNDSARPAEKPHTVVLTYRVGVVRWKPGLLMKIPTGSGICRSHKCPVSTDGNPGVRVNHLVLSQQICLWFRVGELPILVVLSERCGTRAQ
jgi:hypothetical protein